jgi:hypothetical protein
MRFALINLCLFFLSCTGKEKKPEANQNTVVAPAAEKPVDLQTDLLTEGAGFCYFLPSTCKGDSLTCLLFFDPQGKGSVPVEKYRNLTMKFPVALVGSNRSRNGLAFEETRSITQALVRQAGQSFGTRFKHIAIYMAGFSGGAKVAFDAARNTSPSVKGVVYAGAPSAGGFSSVPLFGFAGDQDMNLADVVQFDASLPAKPDHFLRIWKGKHAWPSAPEFEKAMAWISFREGKGNPNLKIQELVKEASKEKDFLEKELMLNESSFLASDMNRPNPAKALLETLRRAPGWQRIKLKQTREFQTELQRKEQYGPAFFQKDLVWWKAEIADLKQHKRHFSAAMQDRLLGFFSLASYSLSHRALKEGDLPSAEKILEIYRLSDPENSEQAYLRSVLAARLAKTEEAIHCLSEAIVLGFSDKARLEQQPEFLDLQANPSFRAVVSKIP